MEWTTLVIFTVLSEVAVGLVSVYALVAAKQARLGRCVFLTAWILTGASAGISLFHLGWPLSAYRVLGGLGSSWLSWEILLTGAFGVGTLALWWRSRTAEVPPMLTGLVSLIGVASVAASGMIYAMPAIPANHNLFPPALFLATALATGGAVLLILQVITKADAQFSSSTALLTLGALVLTGILTVTYATAAAGGLPESQRQAAGFSGGMLYLLRLLVGLAVPAGLLVWIARRPRPQIMAAALAVAAVVVLGEFAGRYLFFHSTVFLTFGL